MVKSKHIKQIHCHNEMRECEHTCPEHSKMQARAKDPSEYLAEILTDGTGDRRTGRERRPDPCLGWATRYVTYVIYLSYVIYVCHVTSHMSRCVAYLMYHFAGVLVSAQDPPLLRGRTYSRYLEVPFNTTMY